MAPKDQGRWQSAPDIVQAISEWRLHILEGLLHGITGSFFWLASFIARVALLWNIHTFFGIDVVKLLHVPAAASVPLARWSWIVTWAAYDVIAYFIVLNRHAARWWFVGAVTLALAVTVGTYATQGVGVGTHCYVMTSDRGVKTFPVEADGSCGEPNHDTDGLQPLPITPSIMLCIRAVQEGSVIHRINTDAVDTSRMYLGDGRSLYWFHRDVSGEIEFYDGPSFHPGSRAPLEPVTPDNMDGVKAYIRQKHEESRQIREKAEAEEKAAKAKADAVEGALKAKLEADEKAATKAAELAEARQRIAEQQAEERRVAAAKSAEAERVEAEERVNREHAAAEERERQEQAAEQARRDAVAAERAAAERQIVERREAEAIRARRAREIRLAQNLYLDVTLARVQNSNAIAATLTLRNASNSTARVALETSTPFCTALRITDGRGGMCSACANGEYLTSLPIINTHAFVRINTPFSEILPNDQTQHVVYFYGRSCSSPITGTTSLSLGGSILLDAGSGVTRASVSMTGLAMP